MRFYILIFLCIPIYCFGQYKGGTFDGVAQKTFTNQNVLPSIYKGGTADGYASKQFLKQNSLPDIYHGDSSDGQDVVMVMAQNASPEIYNGDISDGTAIASISNQNAIPDMYHGGNNDGTDLQLKTNQNTSLPIYLGGDDDGTSVATITNLNQLPEIYAGGGDDGYSLTVILNQNPSSFMILQFSGQWLGADAQLRWITNREKLLNHTELERSEDGLSFLKIATVNPELSDDGERKRSYTDAGAYDLPGEAVFYRLKCIEPGGKASYSEVVRLGKAMAREHLSSNMIAYPNPTSGHFTLDIGDTDATGYEYILAAADGKIINRGGITGKTTSFDLSSNAAGTYHLILMKNGKSVQHFTLFLTYSH